MQLPVNSKNMISGLPVKTRTMDGVSPVSGMKPHFIFYPGINSDDPVLNVIDVLQTISIANMKQTTL
jgi:hypothetical protein